MNEGWDAGCKFDSIFVDWKLNHFDSSTYVSFLLIRYIPSCFTFGHFSSFFHDVNTNIMYIVVIVVVFFLLKLSLPLSMKRFFGTYSTHESYIYYLFSCAVFRLVSSLSLILLRQHSQKYVSVISNHHSKSIISTLSPFLQTQRILDDNSFRQQFLVETISKVQVKMMKLILKSSFAKMVKCQILDIVNLVLFKTYGFKPILVCITQLIIVLTMKRRIFIIST